MLILIFQVLEDLSDREAADAVRDRISWKYALGLSLDDPGFHYSVLSEFRQRLLIGDVEHLLLDPILDLCREVGLLKPRSKQRTDSTHVLAAIRELSRLENVGETLRHALNQLAVVVPEWVRTQADLGWGMRYGKRITEYHLPQDKVERQALACTIGQDGYRLLESIYDPATPSHLRTLPAVEILRQVWVQQFYRADDPAAPVLRWRTSDEQPASAQIISSPYDPEARYKTKRETTWIGYAVHLTETCEDDTPNLITHVLTTPASADDHTALAPIQANLAARDLCPSEHYVDSGYVDAQALVESQRDHHITLVAPVQADPSWQAHSPTGITAAQFAINWDATHVVCPSGKRSRRWQPCTDGNGNAAIVVQFAQRDCLNCALRTDCTKARSTGRQLMLRPREQHLALLAARRWQATPEFKAQYRRRAGVEGSFTQANRRSGLRHARYVGLTKTHGQHVMTAVAINLLRVMAWLTEVPRAGTRTSPCSALMLSSP